MSVLPDSAPQSDEELKAHVRERFTKTAEVFGDYAVAHRVTEAETLARMVGANENDRGVDLASGPGTLALRFARHIRWICALDLTPAILARAQQTAAHDGLIQKMAFTIADAQVVPLADGSLDLAVTSYSLHHISDPARVICEMSRVVKKGGRVGLIDIEAPVDPEVRALNHRIEVIRDNSHSRSLTQGEFESMFAAAGLRITAMEHKSHPRTFEHWMHVAGWKPTDAAYQEAHALLAGSIENNSANFSPRFEPADVCPPGKPPDLYMSNPGIYIAAEKL